MGLLERNVVLLVCLNQLQLLAIYLLFCSRNEWQSDF